MGTYSNRPLQSQNWRDLRKRIVGTEVKVRVVRKPKPPRQLQSRLAPDAIIQFEEDYQAGLTIQELAAKYGVHRTTATRHLKERGIPIRKQTMGEKDIARAVQLYQSGLSTVRVAEHFDQSPNTIRAALLAAGVKFRDTHGRETASGHKNKAGGQGPLM